MLSCTFFLYMDATLAVAGICLVRWPAVSGFKFQETSFKIQVSSFKRQVSRFKIQVSPAGIGSTLRLEGCKMCYQ